MGKKIMQKVIFGNFEMSPGCHGNREIKIEHAVTEAIVKPTFVPSFIITDAFS
jgi:hypothetical protein